MSGDPQGHQFRITIRPVTAHGEYRAVEQLQRAVWNLDDAEIVPDHLLLTVQKNGGLVLGAFDQSTKGTPLVGAVFGFPGFTAEGRLKHCSHMAGVLPRYQNQNLGYRLKLAQREAVLAGNPPIDLITWTFDPLESRNAALNLHKLGAISRTYLRDLYGSMRDELNAGLPSDRLEVEWHITDPSVLARLSGAEPPSLAARLAEGVPVVGDLGEGHVAAHRSPPTLPLDTADRFLIPIPAHFQSVKAASPDQARAWRFHTRALLESAFAAGYVAADLLFDGQHSYYLLTRADPRRG